MVWHNLIKRGRIIFIVSQDEYVVKIEENKNEGWYQLKRRSTELWRSSYIGNFINKLHCVPHNSVKSRFGRGLCAILRQKNAKCDAHHKNICFEEDNPSNMKSIRNQGLPIEMQVRRENSAQK